LFDVAGVVRLPENLVGGLVEPDVMCLCVHLILQPELHPSESRGNRGDIRPLDAAMTTHQFLIYLRLEFWFGNQSEGAAGCSDLLSLLRTSNRNVHDDHACWADVPTYGVETNLRFLGALGTRTITKDSGVEGREVPAMFAAVNAME
jgi:hypothetical protein